MAYIESFLLYLGVVFLGGIVLLVLVFLFLGLIKKLFLKKKRINLKKIFIGLASVYLFSSLFFYVNRANDYLIKDRAYKEAKAYAIVGEYVFLWQASMLNLFNPDNKILIPINALQEYILENIRKNIPLHDAEYEIWNYKFNLIQYARTMYAPMTDESKNKGLDFTNPSSSMKPELIENLNSIFNSIEKLNDLKIQDKEFNVIDKYLVISSMLPYFERYFIYYGGLETNNKDPKWMAKKLLYFWATPNLYNKYEKFLFIINNIHQQMNKNSVLSETFEKFPRIKVSFYWGAVNGYHHYFPKDIRLGNYPCTNPNFLKYISYYKEFVNWAYMTSKSSYKSLSKRERRKYDFMIESTHEPAYYIAKYICDIPFEYMISGERNIEPKYRKKSFSDSLERRSSVKKVREMKEKLTTNNKGNNNGR